MKRIKFSGRAISVRGNDIDTDRIIPARYLRCVTFDGLGEHAFEDDRLQLAEKGTAHSFDNPNFVGASMLFVNKNFGCGSSREHAPQAIMRWGDGINVIVGESFSEIFFGNCVAMGIPCLTVDQDTIGKLIDANEANPEEEFAIDIEALTISCGSESLPITLAAGPRQQFLEGKWDTTSELLAAKDQITATAANLPYFNGWK